MLLIGKILFGLSVLLLVIALSAAGMIIYIIFVKTKQVTEFLAVTDWFGRYCKISQRIRFNSSKVLETRAKYKDKPIREMVQRFNQLFREDFEELFLKLKPEVKYRVVTHYSDVMKKAEAEHKIAIIGEPKVLTKRFLKELKSLAGWRDYRLIKRCFRKKPNVDRCCDKCDERQKCQCKKGEVCKHTSTKIFCEYYFMLFEDHKE